MTAAVLVASEGWRARLQRLLDLDFTQPAAFAAFAAVFFLLRLPYVNFGHGTDPDAWRVAMTAHQLLDTGDYFPSRLPGNPLHELMITVVISGGWLATNLATALSALGGVYIFAQIVRAHRLAQPGLLVIGFAFTPLLYINSIATMDYMWTLTALLGAYYATLRRWPLWAGICLGLAIGFRLQSFIIWPALVLLLSAGVDDAVAAPSGVGANSRRRWKVDRRRLPDVIVMSLAAGGVAAIAYAPVLAVYGLDFYNFYDASVGYLDVFRLLGKEALGVFGGLGVLAGAFFSLRRLRSLPADARVDPVVATWLAVIAIYFVTFLRLPHEIAYLIPVFPFGFLIMGRYFTPRALLGAVAAILLAGVVDVTTPSDALDLHSLRGATIGRGLILSNGVTMTAQHDFIRDVLDNDVPDHSVVVTGFIFPQLVVRERDRLQPRIIERDYEAISMLSDRGETVDAEHDIRYVWLVTYDTFLSLRSQGYGFYLVPDAALSTAALYDYRPALYGATFLRLNRFSPSAGKGTAATDR